MKNMKNNANMVRDILKKIISKLNRMMLNLLKKLIINLMMIKLQN